MRTFSELAASRRDWIDQILIPWCKQACRRDLLAALQDWPNIAGKVDADKTLWFWAWSRFPDLVHDELSGINETVNIVVTINNGPTAAGFPDARESDLGQLVLLATAPDGARRVEQLGPFSIDDIASISRR